MIQPNCKKKRNGRNQTIRVELIALLLLATLGAPECLANSFTWQFTRQDPDDLVVADASAAARAGMNSEVNGGGFYEDPTIANANANASAFDSEGEGDATAESQSLASALNATPFGGTTLLPTLNTAFSGSGISSATTPKYATTIHATEGGASSQGHYLLDGDVTSGVLHGAVYLVGVANAFASGDALAGGGGGSQAYVDGFGADSTYNDETGLWGVSVILPNETFSFTTEDVDLYYAFDIPVTLPYTFGMLAGSGAEIITSAGILGGDGEAQFQLSASGAAWAYFTPLDEPDLPGDFDGDGDADEDDFMIWRGSFGASSGATLSQGDGNHNGSVDAADYTVWRDNYRDSGLGTASASITSVPEPTSIVLSLAFFVAIFGVRPSRFVRAV
jgi:hypothetical protein